jgi:hypothetical protein
MDTLTALVLTALAMYGLGLPLAWLFPAPQESQWTFRLAIAPLYAITLSSACAWVLGRLGVPLHPAQLLVLLIAAWGVSAWRTRSSWLIRESLSRALGPACLVALAGLVWFLSLVGYGLYLPNRDFKNHAYVVAQVAWTRGADMALILRGSPVGAAEPGLAYPVGLHTLLGWVLPFPNSPSVGVTAAAAVLATAISMPLSAVVLARMWDPASESLSLLAGVTSVFLLGLTADFRIGSVVLLVGASLYPAALAALWLWTRDPAAWAGAVAVVLSGVALLILHVAEAVGLALVAGACLPFVLARAGRDKVRLRGWLALAPVGVLVVIASWGRVRGLMSYLESFLSSWDLQRNTEGPGMAVLVALIQQPAGMLGIALGWLALGLVGFWLAHARGLSRFPLVAFLVPVALGTLSGWRASPAWLNLLTAPWYGTAARTGLLAAVPITLAACLSMDHLRMQARSRIARGMAWLLIVGSICALAGQVVPAKRQDLSHSLAGAGDTLQVARALESRMAHGQTVLNFEGDGTANLFAFGRVPVLTAFNREPVASLSQGSGDPPVAELLLRLGDPAVRRRLKQLGVAYIAVGTTSRYWGPGTGYAWQQVLDQPEVQLELTGTDMVILRYLGSPG